MLDIYGLVVNVRLSLSQMKLFTDSMDKATLLLVLWGKHFGLGDAFPLISDLHLCR